MKRRGGASILGLVAGAAVIAAAPQASAAPPEPRTHCKAGETVVYTCPYGLQTASVCAAPGVLIYRYGQIGAPRVEAVGDGAGGPARLATITGGGGGRQVSLRFARQGRTYVVYSAAYGSLTEVPGRRESGVVVLRDHQVSSTYTCPVRGPQQRMELPAGAAVRPETDPEFEAWF
jgi:hypothetical protein